MTRKEAAMLFDAMHPGFFEQDSIRTLPENQCSCELALDLKAFDDQVYVKTFDDRVSFGLYEGPLGPLREAVARVDEAWVPYYDGAEPAYCGTYDGKIVSFALCSDMGSHRMENRTIKIGGPGCVGTLPEFRRRGIGLTVVREITSMLKRNGYDISWIHYTGVAPWYQKLGYEVVLTWNKNGIIL